ncbi:MAG TPA: hypothetical protein VME43_04085 [Bryobacteraceae bacterium]|nr:hypothetical protein [Bryobacteraceae bacterium]
MGHLRSAGFRSTDPSVLIPENQGTKDMAHEKNSKAPEGLSAGAIFGVIIGGVLGYLFGRAILVIPALTSYVAGGLVVSALAGAGALGILGGIIGGLIGAAFPEYEAKRFEGRIRDGGVLLSVHCDNREWSRRAKDVLEETGAQDIAAESEKSGDFANGDKPKPRVRPAPDDHLRTPEPVYSGSSTTRVTPTGSTLPPRSSNVPPPASQVVTGDELYTERVVRRRPVRDPEKLE